MEKFVWLIAGVDAQARLGKGASLVDRFLAGEFGDVDGEARSYPLGALAEHFSGEHASRLVGFVGGVGGENTPECAIVGIEILQMDARSGIYAAGPASLDAIDAAFAQARDGLIAIGVREDPALFLVWSLQ